MLQHAMAKLPNEQFIYYADEDNVPYGEKTREEIEGFAADIIQFMIGKDVKAVLIACNTATSIADAAFRSRFPVPIIGMEPAVKRAMDLYGRNGLRILAAATQITVTGEKMRRLIEDVDHGHLTDLAALPRLVRFAEKGDFESRQAENYLRAELKKFDMNDYSSFVLGCTHFNFFKKLLRRILPENVLFVDGNEGAVNQLIRTLAQAGKLEALPQTVDFYVSGREASASERERFRAYLDWLADMAAVN